MNKWLNVLLVVDLVVVNIVLGLLIYNLKFEIRNQFENQNVSSTQTTEIKNGDVEELRGLLGQLTNRVGNLELTPYPTAAPAGDSGQIKTVVVAAPTRPATKNISFVDIPGSGQTKNLSWVDISGTDFYFDKADYPGLVKVNMESSIRLFNGSGTGYIRLFDVTHQISVVGSEINVSSQSDSLVSSGDLNLWSGNNLYRVQGKSNSSDTVVYNWGKLKITTQQ